MKKNLSKAKILPNYSWKPYVNRYNVIKFVIIGIRKKFLGTF